MPRQTGIVAISALDASLLRRLYRQLQSNLYGCTIILIV